MEFWGYTLLVATQLLLLNRIVLGQFLGSALSSITSHNGLIFFSRRTFSFSFFQYGSMGGGGFKQGAQKF